MSNFKFIKNGKWGDYLLIESNKIEEAITFIKRDNINNIELNFYHGYKIKDINFLQEVSEEIEGLNIIQGDINLNGIEKLKKLKKLYLADELNYPLDLKNFKYLESCSLLWNNNIRNISECKKIRDLLIRKINLKYPNNIELLKGLDDVNELRFIQPKLIDLDFLRYFPNLKEFEIDYASGLKDISGLNNCKNISKLVFEQCKNIQNYEVLPDLRKLNYLGINDCGEIQTISFIKNLKYLTHLSFVGTNILDGDLSHCLGIPHVGFDNKKHYSHTYEDIKVYSLPK